MNKQDWKDLAKKAWDKLSLGFLKAFRGLLCEKKNGEGWELSKGNCAFWLVLSHSMYVWSGKANKAVGAALETAAKAAGEAAVAAGDVATPTSEAVAEAGMLSYIGDMIGSVGVGGGVPDQEFWLLMALLGYATVKHTKGGLTSAMSALRGAK